jgi:uncharacterized protein (TIGR02391 family)
MNKLVPTPFRRLTHSVVGVLRAFARLFLVATPEVKSVENHASTLYRELRAKASTAPLSELLQSLVILAGEVNNKEVEKWAKLELGGYLRDNPEMNNDVVVPEYRTVVGLWHDRYGRPLVINNPKLQFVNSYRLRNGVAELEQLSQGDSPHTLLDPGHAELFRDELNVDVDRIMFGSREVIGVLSNIRTRFIDQLGKLRDGLMYAAKDEIVPEEMKNRLELEGFHPLVIKHASKLLADGHHRQAILDTYIALVDQVKSLAGRYDLDGTPLMNTVFSPKTPKLSLSTDADEQLGFMWLFAGAVMGVRNPKAHAVTPHPDKQTTLEWLGFASVLFRVLDGATKNP